MALKVSNKNRKQIVVKPKEEIDYRIPKYIFIGCVVVIVLLTII